MAFASKLYYVKGYRSDTGFAERHVVAQTLEQAIAAALTDTYEIREARLERELVLVVS